MIFIKKNRLKYIIVMLGVVICSLSYSRNYKDNIISVSTMPVSEKIIVLDAGHGTPDEGAQSKNGTTEAETNLKITMKVKKLLEDSGSKVILTRSNENGIYDSKSKTIKDKKISDLKNRVKIGNENMADIFVSIHLNKINDEQYYGWQCFYRKNDLRSEKLSKKIQSNLNRVMERENKREALKLDNVYIIKHVKAPIAIVECGFLSNPEEERLLITEEYQEKLAWGIFNGINEYFLEES